MECHADRTPCQQSSEPARVAADSPQFLDIQNVPGSLCWANRIALRASVYKREARPASTHGQFHEHFLCAGVADLTYVKAVYVGYIVI